MSKFVAEKTKLNEKNIQAIFGLHFVLLEFSLCILFFLHNYNHGLATTWLTVSTFSFL